MPITFKIITSTKGLWRFLSKNENNSDCMQPIVELIDNSIAAKATIIKITFDFDNNYGYIEDNGHGFPTDPDKLAECFTYSPNTHTQTDLNEHGCGMKASVAILDPKNSSWKIIWKVKGKCYKVQAPYTDELYQVEEFDKWPGAIQDPNGTLIGFPIKKERFNSLYSTKNTSKANILPKLEEELSHYWMKHPKIANELVKIYLNEKYIKPFSVPHDNTNYVRKVSNYSGELSTKAKIDVSHYILEDDLPDSPWFKKAFARNGFYLYKNGRIIQKINQTSLFKSMAGVDNHTTLNGNIVIVNVSGDQGKLPITVPTKNQFKLTDNPLFDEVVDFVRNNVKFEKTKEILESEEKLLDKFKTSRINVFSSMKKTKHEFNLKEQLGFKEESLITPQIDAIEVINENVNIYEAKRENRVSWPHISQLYSNYVLSYDAVKEKYSSVEDVYPILIINCKKSDFVIAEHLVTKIKKLHQNSECGFLMEVYNYDNEELYAFKG